MEVDILKIIKTRIAQLAFAYVCSGFWLPSLTLKGGKTPDNKVLTKNKVLKPEPIFRETNETILPLQERTNEEGKELEDKVVKNVQNVTVLGMALDILYNVFKPKPPGLPPTSGHAARKARLAQKANLGVNPIGTSKANNLPKNF